MEPEVAPSPTSSPTWHQHVLAGICLLVVVLACFSRLVQHPTDILVGPHNGGQNDVTTHVLSFRPLPAFSLRNSSEVPLWNPWSMSGVPWLGNPQSGAFYPPNWLYLLLPSTVCANWLVVLHHWWAGFGLYLLGRRFGLSWIASVGAGIFFLSAPYMLAQTCEGHASQVCLMAWAPWLWLAYERIRLDLSGSVPGAAFVMSMAFFCGHVQELFYLVLIFSCCAGWDAVRGPALEGTPLRLQILFKWLAAGILTGGMVLIEFLPVYSYLRNAARASGITVAQASYGSLAPSSLWQLLDPLAFGGPQNSLDPKSYWWGSYWETLLYFGVGTLLLAVCGLISSPRRYPVLRLAIIALITILFSFGDDTPVFPLLHRFMPGIGMFRAPMRALFHASFAIALLGGFGLDQLFATARSTDPRSIHKTRSAWVLLAGFFAVVYVLASANIVPFSRVTSGVYPQIHWLICSGYLLGVAVTAVLMLRYPKRATSIAAVTLLICTVDLASHARAITRTIPLSGWRQNNSILKQIARDIGSHRLLAPQFLVSDREAWQRGIAKVQAYEPVPLVRWGEFFAALYPTEDPARMLTGFHNFKLDKYRAPLLNLLGVKYAAIVGHDEKSPPGWKILKQDQIQVETTLRDTKMKGIKYTLLENEQVLPRAFVLHHTQSVRSEREAFEALKTLDPRQTIIVSPNFPELKASEKSKLTPVEIVSYKPTQIRLRTELDQPGALCLTDLYYRGWRATDNGRETAIHPGNLIFRAIPLSAGKHDIVMEFSPPGMKLGGIVSMFAWMLWLFVAWKATRHSMTVIPQSKGSASDLSSPPI